MQDYLLWVMMDWHWSWAVLLSHSLNILSFLSPALSFTQSLTPLAQSDLKAEIRKAKK